MNWLNSNWIWFALGVVALFAFGRGGCGMGHRGHDHRRREEGDQYGPPRDTTAGPLPMPVTSLGSQRIMPSSTAHATPSENRGALEVEHAGYESGPSQSGRQRHRHGC